MYLVRVKLLIGIFWAFFGCAECFWGGNNGWGGNGGWQGNYGGFQSGGSPHGHGYGPDICAAARQRQQEQQQGGRGGGSGRIPTSNQNIQNNYHNQYPSEYGGYNHNAYYQDPTYMRNPQQPAFQDLLQPILNPFQTNNNNNNVGQRINNPVVDTTTTTTTTTPKPAPITCPQPNKRDPEVFDQKCVSPLSSDNTPCSKQDVFPIGTSVIVTCKAPHYYSEAGEMLIEICKHGIWQSDGRTLTCKPHMMMATNNHEVPKPKVRPYPQQPYRDPVVDFVKEPQYPNDVIKYPDEPMNDYQKKPSYYWNQTSNPYPPYLPIITSTSTTTTTTTTTPRPTTTTPEPTTTTPAPTHPPTIPTIPPNYNFPHNLDWRNYNGSGKHHRPSSHQQTNNDLHHREPEKPPSSIHHHSSDPQHHYQTDYFHHSDTGKCPPLRPKVGAVMECLSRHNRTGSGSGYIVSVSDCQDQQPHGTEATFKCQMYYEPLTGMVTQYRKCKESGMWSGTDDGFGCKLECGKSNPGGRLPLITFGETTILGQWPWHAALFIRDRGEIANACGGTLISQRAVLTAAHCVNLQLSALQREYEDVRVDLGRYHREKDDPYVQKFKVEKIITHPAYNPFEFESDIAIIILKEPARIGFHVRPICFPKAQNTAFDDMQLADGSVATVVGWGLDETGESPDELRAAKLQVIGYKECISSFEDLESSRLAKSTTFCAGNNNKTNVCRGDSGSGAYFAVKTSTGGTRWYLQGLVSLGINVSANDKTCDPEKVSIFTRVSPYSDWIIRVLSDNDAI